jgi:ATP adenylyltransferase
MHKKFFEPTSYNKILFESHNFIVIPSLGSLLPGWLLVIPKAFSLNLSQLGKNELQELNNLALTCELKLQEKFHSKVVRFEHGPAANQSKVGCGVDYAHLHIVPVNFDLIEGLETRLNIHYEWFEIESIQSLKSAIHHSDYLYYRNSANQHFVTYQQNIPSQLFRRVIAHQLSTPEAFDWKSFPHVETVQETIKNLSKVELVE